MMRESEIAPRISLFFAYSSVNRELFYSSAGQQDERPILHPPVRRVIPDRTVQSSETVGIPNRSDHLKLRYFYLPTTLPQTGEAPHCGALWAGGGRVRPPPFILCKNRTGTERVKTQPFWASCALGFAPETTSASVERGGAVCRGAPSSLCTAFLPRKGTSRAGILA